MSKKIIFIIVVAFALLLAAVTCPTKQEHYDALSQAITDTVDEKLAEETTESIGALTKLGYWAAEKMMYIYLDRALKVDNYLFFSVGELRYQGEDNIVSIGLFRHVFTIKQLRDLNN